MRTKAPAAIRQHRQRSKGDYPDLWVAALWPKSGQNLGTLVRTCDAVGAGIVVPHGANATKALLRGNTIGGDKVWTTFVRDPLAYLDRVSDSHRVVAVELADGSVPLSALAPQAPTVLVLGHENTGVPADAWPFVDLAVEIPMYGVGNSLNVAVAGSLALYQASGLMAQGVAA